MELLNTDYLILPYAVKFPNICKLSDIQACMGEKNIYFLFINSDNNSIFFAFQAFQTSACTYVLLLICVIIMQFIIKQLSWSVPFHEVPAPMYCSCHLL